MIIFPFVLLFNFSRKNSAKIYKTKILSLYGNGNEIKETLLIIQIGALNRTNINKTEIAEVFKSLYFLK